MHASIARSLALIFEKLFSQALGYKLEAFLMFIIELGETLNGVLLSQIL